MLKTARGTQAVLDLEDRAPDVLFESVGDSPIPLWPQFRTLVWSALEKLDYQIPPVAVPAQSRTNAWLHLGKTFLPSRWDAELSRGRAPLCFLVGGATMREVAGQERNWLIGDFVDHFAGRANVIQWAPLPSRLGPPAHRATWSMEPAITRSQVFARLSRRNPEPEVRSIVAEVVRQLDVRLGDEQISTIVAGAVAEETWRPRIDRAFARVLDHLRPSVVLMEEASYGQRASLIAMMKDRGILVAEPQHGWIGPTHAAYNFGAAMYREPLRRTLPDELLTFGEYWGRGLRFPGRITEIGKPDIEIAAASAVVPVAERSEVLVVSSAGDPDEMTRFVVSLRRKLDPRWALVFRPHPQERRVLSQRYPSLMAVDGIRLDNGGDIYRSLSSAAVVIGVASTVLFEAPAFGCRVFVRDSAAAEYYVGDRFGPTIASESDLAKVANEINAGSFSRDQAAQAGTEMWATDAVERFQSWVAAAQRR